MSRSRRDGGGGDFGGLVLWIVLFAFFGPALAIKFTDSLGEVIAILAPYAGALVVVLAGLYVYRTR